MSLRTGALYFPATFPDAVQPGEYVTEPVRIGCVACGVVQAANPELLHACENPACSWVGWIELMQQAG